MYLVLPSFTEFYRQRSFPFQGRAAFVFLLLVCLFFFILVLKKEKFFFILTKKTDFTEFFIIFIFYRVSVIFVRPTKVGQGNYRVFTEFYRVLPLFTGFYLFLPGFT